MERDFLNSKQLQEWLGISKPTLLVWLRKSIDPLPGVKIAGRWIFRREAVLQWWMRQEKGSIESEKKTKMRESVAKVTKAKSKENELISWLSAAAKLLEEESKKK